MNAVLQSQASVLERAHVHSAAEVLALQVEARLHRHLQPDSETSACAEPPSLDSASARPWHRLCELFGLDQAEAELLMFALALAAEPALAAPIAQAQNGAALPTENLIKRLGGHPTRPIWRPTSGLAIWGLLRGLRGEPGQAPGFEADPALLDWMHGTLGLDALLSAAVDRPLPGPCAPEWPVQEVADRVRRVLGKGESVRVLIEARPGSGRRRFAAAVSAALGCECLLVMPDAINPADWPQAFMRCQRLALFGGLALIWREGAPAWPAKLPLAPLQFVCVGEGEAAPQREACADLRLRLPEPGPASKARIFATLAPQLAAGAQRLAATPGLCLADLEDTARCAPLDIEDAASQLRARARTRLAGGGQVIDPQFGWEDLIVPAELADQLRRIAFEVRSRGSLLEAPEISRVFAGAAGLSALFSGPPGVGKSMAAQVIARELGVNLLVIDIASITSKFIGETAKNLSEAFARARNAGAALVFEEADALFARRTDIKDANDRHANTDTNHLLQLMEGHDGLVILSTNRRANLDPAFIRRLRHVLEFPRPGLADRQRLWRQLLQALSAPIEGLEAVLPSLAARHELSPAQIKSAVLSATYSARERGTEIRAADLESAAAEELTKEGRAAPAQARPIRHRGAGRHG
jgi:hypothetical protein